MYGLFVRFGHTLKKSMKVRRPNSIAPAFAMPWAMACPMTASGYGPAQPPCSKPPRKSSSGRPGACITPSSDTFSTAISFLTIPSALRGASLVPAAHSLYERDSGDRQRTILITPHDGVSVT